MNTKQIFYNKRKSESDYFRSICAGAKSMENITLFYYNNTISGLRKSPEQRYHNETIKCYIERQGKPKNKPKRGKHSVF